MIDTSLIGGCKSIIHENSNFHEWINFNT